ncbi:YdeI/OmpD-associated family protein [Dehalogenimonas etheniformans]|uniref:DUF5655 domain-containing protein n=1 Tax=Dehalogenimonas etheniformans TaxID=1536648 RepID=A0A2P5P6R0_9CHLR|nr:DUF5655 domain-containing protein [Dehalogenimonas etheniformans]PPD57983.1 hypothetical protein JP09_006750 [Dehalogenimonas etheniformans]QNT75334.1 YdeI/OmpD-associated family protein [Dehalogenimonas etheniformans]
MVSQVGLLVFNDAGEWHAWLADNHDKAKDAWVVHYKKNSKTPGLRYDEALEQAIAFGWIDGKLKSLDDNRFMLRYSPRKMNSVWSKRNKVIAERLIATGKMEIPGKASVENAKSNGKWDAAYSDDAPIELPEDFHRALSSDRTASENFERFSVSSRNMYVRWIENAKTAATRRARIMSGVERSRQNLKLASDDEFMTDMAGAKANSVNQSPEALFQGRPVSLMLFETVRSYIESLGRVTVECLKTQVSLGSKGKFAWIWLPQMWIKKQPENSIVLTIGIDHRIESPKIKESVQPYPGRWIHHIVIGKESDFDEEMKKWLKSAYEFAQKQDILEA